MLLINSNQEGSIGPKANSVSPQPWTSFPIPPEGWCWEAKAGDTAESESMADEGHASHRGSLVQRILQGSHSDTD